jgi:hypothetical protein
MDETLALWSPSESFTYAPTGATTVSIPASNTKKGSTVTLTVSRGGNLLPPQVIWEGTTKRSIPYYTSPKGSLNCFSGITGTDMKGRSKTNKWQNRKTILEYIDKIIKPYVEKVRLDSLDYEYEYKNTAILIMDNHYSHNTEQNTF